MSISEACVGEPPRRAGRPRDPAKHGAIIEAARTAFFERGFHAATIEDIAKVAGVSKVTVYNRFGDKDTLFEEVIRVQTKRMAAVFETELPEGTTLAEKLNVFGVALAAFKFDKDHLVIERVLMNEIAQVPALAQRFFAAGPQVCMGHLADAIDEAAQRGEITVDDPDRAAEDLVGLWLGGNDLEIKLGLKPPPLPEELRARVERATGLFLKMVGSKP